MDDACHATDSGISEAVNSPLRVEGDRTTTGPTISGIALATRNRWPASSKLGLFEDPQYIRGASTDMHRERQNVAILAASVSAILAASVSASLLTQFVSLTVAPAGIGSPGPLWYPHARAPGHSGQAAVPCRDPDNSRRQPYPADWPAWRRPRNPGRTAYPSGATHHPPPPEARRTRRLARQPISHHHETRSSVAA